MLKIEVTPVSGAAVLPYLEDLARLRIAVFREWPYLYDGDNAYEQRYLAAYARSSRSVFVLALDEGRVVGAATGIPLVDDAPAFQAPFAATVIDIGTVFYFGESVLLPEYRGMRLGHRFFDAREAHARALGRFEWTAFAAVDRASNDPRRPTGHRDHDRFWRGRGYVRQPDMQLGLSWKEIGDTEEREPSLTFWLRKLEVA